MNRITTITGRPASSSDMPRSSGFAVRVGRKKVLMNTWGNLNGYEGTKRVAEFSDAIDAAEWLNVSETPDTRVLTELARRLTIRGTGLSRGIYHQRAEGRAWYTAAVRNKNRRDWRSVAHRWLRRYVGGKWHVGGHHVGRLDGGPAIGSMRTSVGCGRLLEDGRLIRLWLIR